MNQANDNSYLFSREVEEIENVVSRAPDRDLTFNQVFAAKQLVNPTAETTKYTVADTDDGGAKLLRDLADYPRIKISGSEVSTQMRKIGLAFDLPTKDVENSRRWGKALDTEYVERTKRAVDVKINALAYVGDSEFGVPGVLELSGVTSYSGTALSTAGLNVANELTTAVNSIPVIFRSRPYTLVMADQEWKLLTKIQNTFSNESSLSLFKKAHPNVDVVNELYLDAQTALAGGGSVASGTALLIPKVKELVRLPVGILGKVMFKKADQEFDEKVSGKVMARVGSVEAPHPTSIVKITGWS